jgi:hypothetical protein
MQIEEIKITKLRAILKQHNLPPSMQQPAWWQSGHPHLNRQTDETSIEPAFRRKLLSKL